MDDIYQYMFGIIIVIAMVKFFLWKKDDDKIKEESEKKRKEIITKLYEEREERQIVELYNIDEFWKIIDETKSRSNDSYKNQMGLLKDKFREFSPDQLIQLDNLMFSLMKKGFTWDLYGVSSIIFKRYDTGSFYSFLSWLISRGEYIFNNALVNYDIILNQDYKDMDGRLISDIISEVYFKKTNKLIPVLVHENIEMEGQEWKENQLPSRFPNIWDKFV